MAGKRTKAANQSEMRSDELGVAGFFEDLPVLLIVLAGVAALVLSGAYATSRIRAESAHGELDAMAGRFLDSVILSMVSDPKIEHVSIASVGSVNVTRCALASIGSASFEISFVMRYPAIDWIRSQSSVEEPSPTDTGYASRLFTVSMTDGTVGVVEVNAVVWWS